MASGGTENRGQKVGSMASGLSEPRQKGTLWLRFLTEAKSCALLASPQYASVPEPVQNMINNRYQRPFLHWCTWVKLNIKYVYNFQDAKLKYISIQVLRHFCYKV